MDTKYIIEINKLEDSHWWHRSKREVITSILKKHLSFTEQAEILEVGAGTGLLLKNLKNLAKRTALDTNTKALDFCREKGIENIIHSSVEQFSPENNKYTAIIAADIIEHLEDDNAAIQKLTDALVPGGLLIIHVPAKKALFSYWDKMMGHFRRYEKSELEYMLTRHNLTIQQSTFRVTLFYPLVYALRKLQKVSGRAPTSDFQKFSLFNPIFLFMARFENWLIMRTGMTFPFGLSLLVVAKK